MKIVKINSFTLAEMLIVMAIIGIMAMLAIPTVIKTTRDREYADMLNKAYNKIESALILNKILNIDVSSYEIYAISNDMDSQELYQLFKEKLKVLRDCGYTDVGCFGESNLTGYKIRLISGEGILTNNDFRGNYDPVDNKNGILGAAYIDIDGPTGPNKPGIDQFGFYTTYKGLIPMGGPQDNIIPFSECLSEGGFACSAWVLVNKNMDYNICPKIINWETKKSCN